MTTASQERENILVLNGGRRLGYALWGSPAGTPVVMLHGAPGSRLFRFALNSDLNEHGVRLITLDRPGYGRSDYCKLPMLCDWAEDVKKLVDHLGLSSFYLIGMSAGGPHALAVKHLMGERVRGTTLISSLAPLDHPTFFRQMKRTSRLAFHLTRHAPCLLRPVFAGMALWAQVAPIAFAKAIAESRSEVKKMLRKNAAVQAVTRKDIREAMRQGGKGLIGDLHRLVSPWGFDPRSLGGSIFIWHSNNDHNVPISHARQLHALLPGSIVHEQPAAGHLLIFDCWTAIIAELVREKREA